MDAERWQKVKQILENALELKPELRSEFLDKSCGDEVLRREVEELLKFQDTDGDLLEKAAVSAVLENDLPIHNLINKQIGNYTIISELGSGGMGAVYLAERADGEFTQKVALKLIKRGMDSAAILRRFFNERQILASLDHPNIAHLIDGGTTSDASPFFVMEYIEGKTISEYAETNNLSLDERLSLFLEVCTAVSFAHQNLVIHRDLKPSNILITNDGKVKLLDFGIAKLLKTETNNQEAATATQMHVFTPEYASPEQVRGEKLTTSTDVYSLGVILYELLTGNRPFNTTSKNISELIKAVCETEPVRPSAVSLRSQVSSRSSENRTENNNAQNTKNEEKETSLKSRVPNPKLLKGDLDNIILKALRKEPERRYSSVEQFSEDIRRHQAGLPVSASADTWSYRFAKFVQRNKIGAAAAALILITLLAGLGATLYQRNKAQRRFNDVRQLANSFLFEFHDAIENLPGATPARELLVKRALEYLDQLAQEAEGDPSLQRELGIAYAKIGEIQGNSYHSNLGDTEGAMKSYQRSLEIRQKLADADPKNLDLQHELADSYEGVGDMLYTVNDLLNGLQSYEKAVEIREKIVAAAPENLEYRYYLANVLGKRGDICGMEGFPNLGDLPRALESYQRDVALYEEIVKVAPENEKYKSGYATNLHFYGMLLATAGDAKTAIANGRKAVSIFESLIVANPNNTKYETHLMSALVFMRYPLVDDGQMTEAIENAQRVIKTMEKQLAADPQNAFTKRSLGVSYNSLGRIQTEMNDGKAALENHQKALKITQELLGPDAENGEHKRDLALTLEFIGNAQTNAGDCNSALSNYRKSLEIYEKQGSEADDLAGVYSGIGKCLGEIGNLEEAAKTFRQAIPSAEKAAQKSPLNVKKQSRLAIYYLEGGKVLSKLTQKLSGEQKTKTSQEAQEWLKKSKKIFDELQTSGKLAKINEKYKTELEMELKNYD